MATDVKVQVHITLHGRPENLKKVQAKKTREIKEFNFCNFKNGQKSIFELGKNLKLPNMQFHIKKILI